jgi:uncharacterized protein (DUF2147 family)
MSVKHTLRFVLFLAVFFGARLIALGQADPIQRNWYDGDKTGKIQIYKATDGYYYGKIIWLKEPNRDGKPKTDINNPDEKHRNDPDIGLVVLKKFTKNSDGVFEDGTIYDPKNGKTYKCKMTFDGDKLNVRGYVGFSLLGRTEVWTKAD